MFPYAPEMNFNPMLTLTYNRTVERVRDIHITPTGLESTCLMFAHGMGAFIIVISLADLHCTDTVQSS